MLAERREFFSFALPFNKRDPYFWVSYKGIP